MLNRKLYHLKVYKNYQYVLLTPLEYSKFKDHLEATYYEYFRRSRLCKGHFRNTPEYITDILNLASEKDILVFMKQGIDYLNKNSKYNLFYIISHTYPIPIIKNLSELEIKNKFYISAIYPTDQGLLESNFLKQCLTYVEKLKKTNDHLKLVSFDKLYNYDNFSYYNNKFTKYDKTKKSNTFYDIKNEKIFDYILSDQIFPGYQNSPRNHEDEMLIGSLATIFTCKKDSYPKTLKKYIWTLIHSYKYVYILEQDKNILKYIQNTFANDKLDDFWYTFYIHFKLKELQSSIFQKKTSRYSEFKLNMSLRLTNFFITKCDRNFMSTIPKNKNLILIKPEKMYKFDKSKEIKINPKSFNESLFNQFPFIENLFIVNKFVKSNNDIESNGKITVDLIQKYQRSKKNNGEHCSYICGSTLFKNILPGYMDQFKNQFENSDVDIFVSCGYKDLELYFDTFIKNFISKDEYIVEKLTIKNKTNEFKKILITRISTGQKVDLFTSSSRNVDLMISRFHHGIVRTYYNGKTLKFYIGFAETARTSISLDFYMYSLDLVKFKKVVFSYICRGFGLIITKKQLDVIKDDLIKISPNISIKNI